MPALPGSAFNPSKPETAADSGTTSKASIPARTSGASFPHPGCEASFPAPPYLEPSENASRCADESAPDDNQACCPAKSRPQRNPTAGRVERQRMREPPLVSGALGRAHSPDERSFSEGAPYHNGSRRRGTSAPVATRPDSSRNARPFPRENKRIGTADKLLLWDNLRV